MKITIARQCGSGGHEIAEALAEKLHLEIFDKKRFVEEAKKRNVYDENANFLNERPIDSFLYSIAMSYGATNPRDRYIDFVKELTDKLADYPEDVVLVMYGDHLPTMGLTVEDLKNKYLFQTEYVMWDNFGLKKKNENLAAYQMAAEVMDRAGIHEGTVFRYHQARRNTRNYQVDLETLQYDVLYGKQYSYDGENPFQRTKMRMGLYDVTLDSMEMVSTADYTYRLKGTNFTPSSQIKLNGDWYDTVYVNPTTLIISGTEINDFDRLSVVQRSNSSTRKALSKSYDRSAYMLYNENKWKIPAEESYF